MFLPKGDHFPTVLVDIRQEVILQIRGNLKRLSNPSLYSDSWNGLGWIPCLELRTDKKGSPSSTFDI